MIPVGTLSHRVTIRHRTAGVGEDRYGDLTPRYEVIDEVPDVPARVDYRDTDEDTRDSETTEEIFVVFLNAGAVVSADDAILWQDYGIELEVVGPPQILDTPRGPHHLEVEAKRVTG